MELTYKTRGADGKEYGPATLAEIKTWMSEGRINGQSEVTRSDIDYWALASNFSELEMAQTPAAAPAPQPVAGARPVTAGPATAPAAGPASLVAQAQLKSGASWFYWIAGLSLVNSAIAMSGTQGGFILGLGITQIFDAISQSMEGGSKTVVLLLDVVAAGIFALFGVFAHKRHTWAFVVGMILYALDGVIFFLFQEWIGLGFHVFALFCLFRGFTACRVLNAG